ncbi:cytochrome P450-dit2 [Pseudocyphellaria aurata]|nr:cytochrome P450-dit2 [Pseudocyphellaria aurata]
MAIITLLLVLLIAIIIFGYSYLLPPKHLPRNIPTVPFFVSLIPFFKTVDQSDTYRRYLEKPLAIHGAVKVYFGSQWNVLLTRPEYVAEMFRDEDTFAKSGNQKKIPGSVLAEYTGDNIISSHGTNWRLYQSVIKPGLQRNFDVEPIYNNAMVLLDLLRSERQKSTGGGVLVPQLLQRYTLANLSQVLLCTSFQTLEMHDAPLHTLQLAVKKEIFNPVFLSFPFLDHLPIPSRKRARNLVKTFTDELCKKVCDGHKLRIQDNPVDALATRMIRARETGTWSEQQLRHNMVSVFLAGHENPQLNLTSMIYLLGKNEESQQRLRREIDTLDGSTLAYSDAQNLPYLTSVIYESLRLFPPISQLLNRKTTRDVCVGGKFTIPAGTYVGYNAYATGRSKQAWGEDADEFRPERWGLTIEDINARYRQANSRAEFIAFHGGRRACLGQRFAIFQVRITIIVLIRALKWRIDPSWHEAMTPAGPLYPRQLRIIFEDV